MFLPGWHICHEGHRSVTLRGCLPQVAPSECPLRWVHRRRVITSGFSVAAGGERVSTHVRKEGRGQCSRSISVPRFPSLPVAACPPCGSEWWSCSPVLYEYCSCVPRRLCRDGVQHCLSWSDEYICRPWSLGTRQRWRRQGASFIATLKPWCPPPPLPTPLGSSKPSKSSAAARRPPRSGAERGRSACGSPCCRLDAGRGTPSRVLLSREGEPFPRGQSTVLQRRLGGLRAGCWRLFTSCCQHRYRVWATLGEGFLLYGRAGAFAGSQMKVYRGLP